MPISYEYNNPFVASKISQKPEMELIGVTESELMTNLNGLLPVKMHDTQLPQRIVKKPTGSLC